jgi:glutamate 5-kinase
MESKIAAAKIATAAGASVIIASGHVLHPLRSIADARSTLFLARVNPTQARKRWIAGGTFGAGHDRHRRGRRNARCVRARACCPWA